MTRIVLVADDYGISPAVNRAIRELMAMGRISATSAMMPAPALDAAEVRALLDAAERPRIGLHLTLTAPFQPLTGGAFRSIGRTALAAAAGRIDRAWVAREIHAQFDAFGAAFGRPPDYVDGHQHVHLLPPVAEVLLPAMKAFAPNAWARQCGRPAAARTAAPKALVLDTVSRGFRRRAATHDIATNPAFAGAYAFRPDARYADLFPGFLTGMEDGGVIMCHPGVVDDALRALDPLTTLREHEFAYFRSDAFPALLDARGIRLA